ncbi:MAG: hypothetical protein AAF684_09755, partial [Pseudomonadota bacterium]
MTSVFSPVPSLGLGLSNGLRNIARLGEEQASLVQKLDAGSRLVDQQASVSALAPLSRIEQQVDSYQRLTGVVSEATSLTLEAATGLNDIRSLISEAEDLITIVNSVNRSTFELQRADVDFQRILEDIELRAEQVSFDDAAILTNTSAISSDGFAPPLSVDVINLSARNFDNRPTADGGDGAFTVTLNSALNAGAVDFTATATSAAGLIATYTGTIDAADVDSTTAGSEFLTVGKTVVLELDTADAGLASLTQTRSQIVLSIDAGTLADPTFGAGGAGSLATTFNIDQDADGGAFLVEGRAAPVIDGSADFQIQIQGSILKALGLTGGSLRDQGRLESASEAVQQALDYIDLALVDVESANRILDNAA